MSTSVQVTGARRGGGARRPVAERLRAARHRVHPPTLPGPTDGDRPCRHSLDDVCSGVDPA